MRRPPEPIINRQKNTIMSIKILIMRRSEAGRWLHLLAEINRASRAGPLPSSRSSSGGPFPRGSARRRPSLAACGPAAPATAATAVDALEDLGDVAEGQGHEDVVGLDALDLVEGRGPGEVAHARVGPVPAEHLDDAHVAGAGRQVQGSVADVVAGVDVAGAAVEEHLDGLGPVEQAGQVEGRAALRARHQVHLRSGVQEYLRIRIFGFRFFFIIVLLFDVRSILQDFFGLVKR